MSEFKISDKPGFDDLVALMARLRSPEGCPWDVKQTFKSIRDYLIEEVYEAVEAIDKEDWQSLKEELGDVVFEAVFLGQIGKDEGLFDIYQSIDHIYKKLIYRHPHVFGEVQIKLAEEVPGLWEKMKKKERAAADGTPRSALDGIPTALPPLMQALRISERAVSLGFEWDNLDGVLEKLDEEVAEFKDAVRNGGSREEIEDEVGDMLFTMVNVARKLDIKAHDGLKRTMTKFRKRFAVMETELRRKGREMNECKLDELEALWQAAKKELKNS